MDNTNQVNELTLREMILGIKDYLQHLVRNKWLIILSGLIVASFFLYKHFTHIPTYNAELRFVVEGQGGVSGGIGGLLGSFGIKKGGSVNPYKIIEVAKSNKLLEDVVNKSFDNDRIVAQALLDEYDLVQYWAEKDSRFEEYRYGSNLDTSLNAIVFKRLKDLIWGNSKSAIPNISKLVLNEEEGIYSLSTNSVNEKLSVDITNALYKGVKQFFEDEIFENQKRSADILAAKTDSINKLRTAKIYELARFEDSSNGLYIREASTRKTVLTQEIQALGIAYAELIKNYEMTDVNLRDLQPLFMEIDRPMSPISPSESSIVKNLLIGFILGSLIASLVFIILKIYSDIMKPDHS